MNYSAFIIKKEKDWFLLECWCFTVSLYTVLLCIPDIMLKELCLLLCATYVVATFSTGNLSLNIRVDCTIYNLMTMILFLSHFFFYSANPIPLLVSYVIWTNALSKLMNPQSKKKVRQLQNSLKELYQDSIVKMLFRELWKTYSLNSQQGSYALENF